MTREAIQVGSEVESGHVSTATHWHRHQGSCVFFANSIPCDRDAAMVMTHQAVQIYAGLIAGWAAAALGLSLPISTSLDGIILVIMLVAWAVGAGLSQSSAELRGHRVLWYLPGAFLILALGTVHGFVPFSERIKLLWKYNDLLFPVVFVPLFLNPDVRRWALVGFGCSMAATLVLSYLLATGWIPSMSWLHGLQGNATVFKHQITHNLLMAFAALLFAAVAVRQRVPWRQYGLGLLALLAVVDVFMLVKGRTGQIVLSALIILWCERRFGIRGILMGLAAVLGLVGVSYLMSPVFQARVDLTVKEMERAQVELVAQKSSSVGIRLEWYKNTLSLIAEHPVLGVGTGSFARAYAELVTDPAAVKPSHPHNQYFLTSSELGIMGMGLWPALFGALWWKFRQIGTSLYAELGQGMVLLMGIGCLFNSFLVDHTEGLFFAWMISVALAGEDSVSIEGPR